MAKLRLDGFVSIDADSKEGSLTTKPLKFTGKNLTINAAAEKGYVLVEVLDENGYPIDGFSKKDWDTFSSDSVRHTVTWKGKSDLASLQGRCIQLRFYLKQAKLYSFAFTSK